MANNYTTVIVRPPIPKKCVTDFEKALLGKILTIADTPLGEDFYMYSDGDGMNYIPKSELPTPTTEDEKALLEEVLLSETQDFFDDDSITLGSSATIPVFKRILERSDLPRITIGEYYSCNKCRADGFAAATTIVTRVGTYMFAMTALEEASDEQLSEIDDVLSGK